MPCEDLFDYDLASAWDVIKMSLKSVMLTFVLMLVRLTYNVK
jgi:hypothetical protein